jgi:hypothetical protein
MEEADSQFIKWMVIQFYKADIKRIRGHQEVQTLAHKDLL